jgi:four helix bundle protein
MSDYTKLEVWQKSRLLARDIYKASESFPPDEKFGLTHQIRRAVVSIPSNMPRARAEDQAAIAGVSS